MFGFKKKESRSLENPLTPLTAISVADALNQWNAASTGVVVTIDKAMQVPAVGAAVNFLAGTLASLPLNVYEKDGDSRKKTTKPIQNILNKAVNSDTSSFDWRNYIFSRTLTGGRSFTFIARNNAGRVIDLFPLDPSMVVVKRVRGKKQYEYTENGVKTIYESREIIDIPFAIKSDLITHVSPIFSNSETIGLSISATQYGAKLFDNGGVPPFVMTGSFKTGAGLKNAADDIERTLSESKNKKRQVLTLPASHEIKSLGVDPEKMQLVELKRFLIEEIARIYSLPPNFIQDLTHATFSNVEQQDLHLVKHTIRRWVTQVEQEINLKLFGRGNTSIYAEFNLDGILRGDFSTRMAGYAQGIQNAIIKPNEARAMENRPDDDMGNELLIQGATVPLGSQKHSDGESDGQREEI